MVAEVALGQPHTPLVAVYDAYGSPVEAGVSGLLSAYGPGAADTLVAGPLPVSWFGGPNWGATVPAFAHAAAGTYRWVVPSLSAPGVALENQGGLYTVGVIPPEYRTYREILVALALALDAGVVSRTTTVAGKSYEFEDVRYADAGYATNEFVDDEVVWLEPLVGGPPACRVSSFNPAYGIFGLRPEVDPRQTAAGNDYLLLRPGPMGLRLARLKEALDAAIADVALRQPVTDEVTLTTASTQRRYAYPAGWLDVTRVQVNRVTGNGEEYWETVPPAAYELWPERRLLVFRTGWLWDTQGYPLRLTGRAGLPAGYLLSALVRVPWRVVRDAALGYLMLPPREKAALLLGQARAGLARLDTR